MITIIPAIDIIGGQCVRLTQGDYARTRVYCQDPLDMAKRFEDCGVRMLHLVDLDGAKSGFPENQKVLEDIVSRTSLNVEFGGGIRERAALASVFDAGAYRAICGSVACAEPDRFIGWLKDFGGERLVLGADVRDGLVAVKGWQESSSAGIGDLLSAFIPEGLKTVIVTDISRDGMLSGPAVGLYRELLSGYPDIGLVASGGVGTMDDIEALEEAGVPAVIVGKAIYEGKIKLLELC